MPGWHYHRQVAQDLPELEPARHGCQRAAVDARLWQAHAEYRIETAKSKVSSLTLQADNEDCYE